MANEPRTSFFKALFKLLQYHRNQKGQSTILVPFGVLMVTTIAIMTYSDFFKKNQGIHKKLITRSLLQETTLSTFAIMESALKRRMWEAPPDANCMRSETFSVSGETPYKVKWNVAATYEFEKSLVTMVATGKDKYGNEVQFIKQIKIMDASDYLLISTNKADNIQLLRHSAGTRTKATSLVAGHRRIYTSSPVEFTGNFYSNRITTSFSTSPPAFTNEQAVNSYGTIIQGQRIQFTKGLRYMNAANTGTRIYTPTTTAISGVGAGLLAHNIKANTLFNSGNILDPTLNNQSGSTKYLLGQSPSGGVIFYSGNQKNEASDHVRYLNNEIAGVSSLLNRTQMDRQVYPFALAGKTSGKPIITKGKDSIADDGDYDNNISTAQIVNFYVGENWSWNAANVSCLAQVTSGHGYQHCSYSERQDSKDPLMYGFPVGFSTWREDANLTGSLYTSDAEETVFPTLDWDNLSALKDDAVACGQVAAVTESSETYEDCEVWDEKFITKYRTTGADSIACSRVLKLKQSEIDFQNFNKSTLASTEANKVLRRVIFSDQPLEIAQSDSKGVLHDAAAPTHYLNDVDVRKKLPIWIVSTDYVVFRGFQKDLTSPLVERPGEIRQIYFNKDLDSTAGDTTYIDPLNLAVLSTEKIQLISPQYVPMSKAHMVDIYPVDSARQQITPKKHNPTDHVRYEDDAFNFGQRDFNIERVAFLSNTYNVGTRANYTTVISGATSNYAYPNNGQNFFLKGLWYIPAWGPSRVRDLCMIWDPAHLPATQTAETLRGNYIITTEPDQNTSPLPPRNSKFYLQSDLGSKKVTNVNVAPHTQAHVGTDYRYNMPPYGMPWVFALQRYQQVNTVSAALFPIVSFTGISMNFEFTANSTLADTEGLRDLRQPKYNLIDSYRMYLSDQKFAFADDYVFKPENTPVTCMQPLATGGYNLLLSNFKANTTAAAPQREVNMILLNNGTSNLQFNSPSADFDGLGAIVGVQLPVFKVRGK